MCFGENRPFRTFHVLAVQMPIVAFVRGHKNAKGSVTNVFLLVTKIRKTRRSNPMRLKLLVWPNAGPTRPTILCVQRLQHILNWCLSTNRVQQPLPKLVLMSNSRHYF